MLAEVQRMRKFVFLVLVLSFTALAQEPDFSKVEMKVQKVAEGVYMLQGEGGNIGVSVGEDGVLLIDDEFAPLAPKIQAAIKGISDKPIRWVLNTHWHGDHTGANAEFAKAGTEVIAQDNVRKRLQTGMPERKREPAPKDALPIITFDNSLTVHINGEDIRALHYANGHTDGDSIIFFPKANVVHMGDDFVTYGLPYVDSQSGGTVHGMVENVEKAMAAVPDGVKVIPGHGNLSTKADVKKFTDMLRDCIALVQAGMKQGKSLEQMKKGNVIAKYDSEGKGFVKPADFIELIYNELQGRQTTQTNRKHH
jgi:glyoxylase-like metal-dependent hydrolase (beta-lactamase superfamily II)